jgi:hypothetical protein
LAEFNTAAMQSEIKTKRQPLQAIPAPRLYRLRHSWRGRAASTQEGKA